MPKPWPYNQIREPRPADWGIGMTVCIAAVSNDTIVCAADMKLSMLDLSMSGDSLAYKMAYFGLGHGWICLMADDLSVYEEVRKHLFEFDEKKGIRHNYTIAHITEAFKYAFEKELRIRAESDILFPYGLTFDNYRDEGPKLGPEIYSRIIFDLQAKELGLKLLIAGFDERQGHIFTVGKRGLPEHYEGFWAVGSGDLAALGYLFSTDHEPLYDPPSAFHRVCCAKFAAETSPGVGKSTLVCVLKKNGARGIFMDHDLVDIRKEWERLRRKRISVKQKNKIKLDLDSIKPSTAEKSASAR